MSAGRIWGGERGRGGAVEVDGVAVNRIRREIEELPEMKEGERGGHRCLWPLRPQILKGCVCVALIALIFSIFSYQSGSSDSSSSSGLVWLSFSFVSHPSLMLSPKLIPSADRPYASPLLSPFPRAFDADVGDPHSSDSALQQQKESNAALINVNSSNAPEFDVNPTESPSQQQQPVSYTAAPPHPEEDRTLNDIPSSDAQLQQQQPVSYTAAPPHPEEDRSLSDIPSRDAQLQQQQQQTTFDDGLSHGSSIDDRVQQKPDAYSALGDGNSRDAPVPQPGFDAVLSHGSSTDDPVQQQQQQPDIDAPVQQKAERDVFGDENSSELNSGSQEEVERGAIKEEGSSEDGESLESNFSLGVGGPEPNSTVQNGDSGPPLFRLDGFWSQAPPPQLVQPLTNLKKLEEELLGAKKIIEAATVSDNDDTLYGLIYRNVSTFSRSYDLMEQMFRVYVYKEGDKPLVHAGPLTGIYASEGQFIERLLQSSAFMEEDPEKAHMFFLPYSVAQMVLDIYVPDSHDMLPLNTFVKNYVDEVASKHSFWNRTQGADHFFVSCHDWGPATARDHEQLRKNAVKVVCNADSTEEFVVGKDVSLPEIYLHNLKLPKVGGPGPSRRPFLAFFAGQMHGHVRPILLEYWKDKDPSMKIFEVLPQNIAKKKSYAQHMKSSKYCICAAGYEVNSPRVVESIYYDCVPVVIADNFLLPFSDVLNWSTFSLTLPESEIPNLKNILSSIPLKHYMSMQKRLSKVRQHFLWHDQPVKYDVFHMILHSVWLSRINGLHS